MLFTDLSLLLKQEFDAKNAELNQTNRDNFFTDHISPSGLLTRPGSQVIPVNSQEELDSLIDNITNRHSMLGPPYQLPLPPVKWPSEAVPSVNHSEPVNINRKGITDRKMLTPIKMPMPTPSSPPSAATKPPNVITRLSSENVFYRVKHPSNGQHQNTSKVNTPRKHFVNISTVKPSVSNSTMLLDGWLPGNSPNFVNSFSNDLRYKVDPTLLNYTHVTRPKGKHKNKSKLNDSDLHSDESRVLNSNYDMNPSLTSANKPINNSGPTRVMVPNSTYRLTTERLAYILIGSCCALSIICLIIVAMSVRFKDMCDEYRSWKNAEKAAIKWQRQQRLRMAIARNEFLPPYQITGNMLDKNRLNLPRYFRTSIDNKNDRPNKTEKILDSILSGTKLPEVNPSPVSTCCHCINCSSTWFFRNNKHGDWCCQRGYLQPPRRSKLPFGAGSSVNTFMPRFTGNSESNGKTNAGKSSGDIRFVENSGEGVDMCANGNNALLTKEWNRAVPNGKCKSKPKEKCTSGQMKLNPTGRYFHDSNVQEKVNKCNLNANSDPMFCEIDYENNDEDDEEIGDEVIQHFQTNCDAAKANMNSESHCNIPSSSFVNFHHQKCSNFNQNAVRSHVANKSKHGVSDVSEYFQNQCKYYFDSPTINRSKGYKNGKSNDRSSSIWINSSKIVDKLHRKHQTRSGQVSKSSKPKSIIHQKKSLMAPNSSYLKMMDECRRKHLAATYRHYPSSHHPIGQLVCSPKYAMDDEHNFVVWNNDTDDRLI